MTRKDNTIELCQYENPNKDIYKVLLVLNDFEESCNTLYSYVSKENDQRKITRNRFNRITKILIDKGEIIIYKVHHKFDIISEWSVYHIIKIKDYFVSNTKNLIELLIEKMTIHNNNFHCALEIHSYILLLDIIVNNFYTTEKILLVQQSLQIIKRKKNNKLLFELKRNNKKLKKLKNIYGQIITKQKTEIDQINYDIDINQENNEGLCILRFFVFLLIICSFIYFYVNN